MRKPAKLRLLVALFLAFSLLAGACGDDDDTAEGTTDDTTEDTTEDTTDDGVEDGEVGELSGAKGTTPAPETTPEV